LRWRKIIGVVHLGTTSIIFLHAPRILGNLRRLNNWSEKNSKFPHYSFLILTLMSEEKQTNNDALGHIDYKDITTLRTLINPHARMYGRKRTGFTAKAQRDFARAAKRARFMALMPFVTH
jgi:small subunit ribosomal protein S18